MLADLGAMDNPGTGVIQRLVLAVLMFAGGVGTITLASALALRERGAVTTDQEERPIVG